MTYSISDAFSDPLGRWNQFAPWDGTEHSDSAKGFLTTQEHVDLRAFRVQADRVPRPLSSLDASSLSALDEEQTDLESSLGTNILDEAWAQSSNFANSVTAATSDITDATRAAGVSGDGRSADGSFGIWRATTNLCTNGGFETNTAGWAGTAAISRDTTYAKFGSASLKFVASAVSQYAYINATVAGATAGLQYTASVWIYADAAAVGKRVTFVCYEFGGASPQAGTTTPVTLVAGWQRVTASRTFTQNDRTACQLLVSASDVSTFWIDGAQIESGTFATPYVHTDGATAARAVGRAQMPSSLLNATTFWAAFRVRYGWNAADRSTEFPWLFEWRTDTNNRISCAYLPTTSKWEIVQYVAGVQVGVSQQAGVTAARDAEETVIFQVTATQLMTSVGGAPLSASARGGILTPTGSTFDIATLAGAATDVFGGDILFSAFGVGTLTNTDVATIYSWGSTPPSISSLPASPTALWTADTASYSESSGLINMTTGPIAARGGWSGLQMAAQGSPVDCSLTSSMTEAFDISAMDSLVMSLPDYNALDPTSAITLTSSSDGSFTDATYESAAVPFSANEATMPEFKRALSAFTTGAGVNFNLSAITGIRIRLIGTATVPPQNSTITIQALRAVKSTWTESALDFDTRLQALVVPVTFDGNLYAGTVAKAFEFVRGDGSKDDPIPADAALNLYFYPGGAVANDATGSNYNKLAAIFRETKDSADGLGSHLEIALLFNDTSTTLETQRVDSTGGSPGTTSDNGLLSLAVGSALDPTKHYLFRAEVRGTQCFASLYETDIDLNVGDFVWQNTQTISDANYTYRNGRVGFIADFLTRDAYLTQIDAAPTGYASLTTEVFSQRTPVDGARLQAVFADDENLWQSYSGSDIFIDQTKTTSNAGSFRTALGLTSNSFIIDDWTQTYLDVDIWVPSNVTLKNQPIIILNTPTGTETVVVPRLQPAQWNSLHFDFGFFRNLLTGVGYSISILPASDPDKPLGNFWVDSTVLGRRRVSWSIRATENGPWRQFRDLVNKPTGAVHFPANERGTQLQLKADALTEDAWVSSFKVFPRHAELGLPVYDQAFDVR